MTNIELSPGYALYEVCANSTPAGAGERALAGSERVGDVLARWEKAGATAAACRYWILNLIPIILKLKSHPSVEACRGVLDQTNHIP